ncbi:unnamed protein product [Urochloa humidicola]
MARKKVALQWIANDATRRATFKKRRKGLMKKASELATLCDVEACVVVYGEGESRPEVWPEAPGAAERVVARFKDVPELDQCKKMLDMEGYMRQQVDKLRENLHKAQRENREREAAILLHDAIAGRRPGLAGLSVEEVAGLGWMVEARIRAVRAAIGSLPGEGVQDVPPLPPAAALPLVPYSAGAGAGGHSRDMMMMMMMQAPQPQGWMMAGGRDIGALAYGGVVSAGAGAGTSAGAGGDMPPQLGSAGGFGFKWPDAGQSFPSM